METRGAALAQADAIPREILGEASAICGKARDLVPLHGLSYATVVHYRGTRGEMVIKKTNRHEMTFYRDMRQALLVHGVDSPQCLFDAMVAEDAWLGLEYVGAAFPMARFPHDAAILGALAAIHGIESADLQPHGVLDWGDEHTRAVAAQLGPRRREVESTLRELQALRQSGPDVLVWGDANPLNWRMRADGRPVLRDWQRWGRGWRAYDLAGVIPGLGDREAFRKVSDGYRACCAARGLAVPAAAALAREIQRGKAWAVVELLGLRAGAGSTLEKTQEIIRGLFADWLEALA